MRLFSLMNLVLLILIGLVGLISWSAILGWFFNWAVTLTSATPLSWLTTFPINQQTNRYHEKSTKVTTDDEVHHTFMPPFHINWVDRVVIVPIGSVVKIVAIPVVVNKEECTWIVASCVVIIWRSVVEIEGLIGSAILQVLIVLTKGVFVFAIIVNSILCLVSCIISLWVYLAVAGSVVKWSRRRSWSSFHVITFSVTSSSWSTASTSTSASTTPSAAAS